MSGSFDYGDNRDWERFVLTLPMLRLFSGIKRTRGLVFTLIQLIPGTVEL